MRNAKPFLVALVFGILLAPVRAAVANDFYKGKTVQLIISSSTGGGYDIYARSIARFLQKHIAGNPTVVPQNMVGGGGVTAANYLYQVAASDGTVIGALQNTVPLEPFYENKLATFDPVKFGWLGTPTTEVGLYIVFHTSKIKTLADAQSQSMTAGGMGAASTQVFYARLFNDLLGMKARIVNGYPAQTDIFVAMERGEVEANSAPFWSSMKVVRPDWYRAKTASFLFQYGARPHPELPDVPFAYDMLKSDADRQLWTAAMAPLALGRPYVAPPKVPADRMAILTSAFEASVRDPDFQAECKRLNLECGDVKTGAELLALVKDVYATPATVHKRLVSIYASGE
jgi:tripartite-type tricarboxylate transporter receptor subunit TctC